MTMHFPTDSVFDGSTLAPVWRRLQEVEAQMEDADDWFRRTQVISDRRLDGSHRSGTRAYILANSLIAKARENQHLLEQTLTTSSVGVFPHATSNLVRPAFEAAATALWILDGEDSQARRLRGLRCAWEDHRQSSSWADELLIPSLCSAEEIQIRHEKRTEISKRYRDDASDLGIRWDRVTQSFNLRDEIGKLTVVRDAPDLIPFLRAIWRRLSGIQHGLSYASLLGAERYNESKIPGGIRAILVIDDNSLLTDCRASALMQQWAMAMYIQRTRNLVRS